MAERPVGSERGELLELLNGRAWIGLHESGAEILASFEIVRIAEFDLAIFADGGDEIAFVGVGNAEVVARANVGGVKRESFFVRGDGAIEILEGVQQAAKVNVSQDIVGLGLNGFLVFGFGGVEVLQRLKSSACVDAGDGVVGIFRERGFRLAKRFVRIPRFKIGQA